MKIDEYGTKRVRLRVNLLWVALLLGLMAGASLVLLDRQIGVKPFALEWVSIEACAALLLAAGSFFVTRKYVLASLSVYTAPESIESEAVDRPTDPNLIMNDIDVLGSIPSDIALQFIYMVAYPSKMFDRISDSAEPLTRSLSLTTTVSFSANGRRGETVIVPVLMRQRGTLEDGLRFFVNEGRVSSLNHHNTVVYCLAVIRSIIGSWGFNHWYLYCNFAERRFAEAIDSSQPLLRLAVDEMVDWIENTAPEGKKTSARALGDFLRALEEDQPLCVPLILGGPSMPLVQGWKRSGPRKVSSERRDLSEFARWQAGEVFEADEAKRINPSKGPRNTVSREDPLAKETRRWFLRVSARRRSVLQFHFENRLDQAASSAEPSGIDRLRRIFGIRPTLIAVPLRNAGRAKSYHLSLAGLDGTYLARQQVIRVPDTTDAVGVGPDGAAAASIDLEGDVVARLRNGQRHAHLHIANGANTDRTAFVAQFYERMPGSMAPAFASALSVAVLVWVALFADKRYGSPLFENWEYPALVLAFPAAISIWLGLSSERRLSEGVLAGRVSLICTVVLAIIASGFSVAQEHTNLSFLWLGLALLATVNAIAPGVSWILRAHVHSHFVESPPGRGR